VLTAAGILYTLLYGKRGALIELTRRLPDNIVSTSF
jgi:hypothetical protein